MAANGPRRPRGREEREPPQNVNDDPTTLTTRRPQGTVGHGAVRRLRFKIRKKSFQCQIFARNSKMNTKRLGAFALALLDASPKHIGTNLGPLRICRPGLPRLGALPIGMCWFFLGD